jgi:hypothetical protein
MRPHAAAVLFALAGGGAAWALHLFAAYFVVAIGCARGWPAPGWLLAGITVIFAAAAASVAVVARRARRRARGADDSAEARRLLHTVGMLLGGLFAVMILVGGLTALALPPCQSLERPAP